jgi:hypothetical protein
MYYIRLFPQRVIALALCFLLVQVSIAQKTPKHNDIFALTGNADKNVQLLNNYLDALLAGNLTVARSYLATDFVEYGPAMNDSSTQAQVIQNWEMANRQRSDESITDRQTVSIKAKNGPARGEWVMGWGTYHWKENGTMIHLPFQVTALVNDNKIQKAIMYYDRSGVMTKLGYVTIPPNVDPDAYMIRKVIEAETAAWLKNDGQEMGTYWADLPYAAHTVTDEEGKAYIITATEIGQMVSRLSTQKPNQPGTTFTNSNYNIRPNGNAAWASFEQTFKYPDGRTIANLENRYLEKIDGKWKITHMTSIPKR